MTTKCIKLTLKLPDECRGMARELPGSYPEAARKFRLVPVTRNQETRMFAKNNTDALLIIQFINSRPFHRMQ